MFLILRSAVSLPVVKGVSEVWSSLVSALRVQWGVKWPVNSRASLWLLLRLLHPLITAQKQTQASNQTRRHGVSHSNTNSAIQYIFNTTKSLCRDFQSWSNNSQSALTLLYIKMWIHVPHRFNSVFRVTNIFSKKLDCYENQCYILYIIYIT